MVIVFSKDPRLGNEVAQLCTRHHLTPPKLCTRIAEVTEFAGVAVVLVDLRALAEEPDGVRRLHLLLQQQPEARCCAVLAEGAPEPTQFAATQALVALLQHAPDRGVVQRIQAWRRTQVVSGEGWIAYVQRQSRALIEHQTAFQNHLVLALVATGAAAGPIAQKLLALAECAVAGRNVKASAAKLHAEGEESEHAARQRLYRSWRTIMGPKRVPTKVALLGLQLLWYRLLRERGETRRSAIGQLGLLQRSFDKALRSRFGMSLIQLEALDVTAAFTWIARVLVTEFEGTPGRQELQLLAPPGVHVVAAAGVASAPSNVTRRRVVRPK